SGPVRYDRAQDHAALVDRARGSDAGDDGRRRLLGLRDAAQPGYSVHLSALLARAGADAAAARARRALFAVHLADVSHMTRSFAGSAVITGSGQGLGRAFALALAAEGVPVVVADLNAAKAEHVAAEVAVAGGQAVAVEVNVADPASVEAMAQTVCDRLGPPRILVN